MIQVASPSAFRIGYASQAESSIFAQEVTASIRLAAERARVQLVFVDNRGSPEGGRQKARRLAKGRGNRGREGRGSRSAEEREGGGASVAHRGRGSGEEGGRQGSSTPIEISRPVGVELE